jgi:FADH2 O2-dependent halogenase
MSTDFDIAVVGSGFGGSLTAMIAKRLGYSVVMIERGGHPRFVIGESSTPLANLLLEELARRYGLSRLSPLAKWGTWQRTYPQIACGLKRGFTFYHHRAGESFAHDPEHRNELLVAASPRDEIADTHWYRAEFDHFLVGEAQALGVEYLDRARLENVSFSGDSVTLAGNRDGQGVSVRARFVIDATGPRGFLHRALRLPEASFDNFPSTQALYSHFSGVKRWEDLNGTAQNGPAAEPTPYPVDDAAVHHIYDGGWIWILRFNNGVTSAGVAATDKLATDLGFANGASAWSRLLQRLPTLHEQFADASPQFPFVHAPRLSFRSGVAAGPRWVLLPSAAGFVDPLLSTGFPLTLLGVSRLAEILAVGWNSSGVEQRLNNYARLTLQELDAAARLVSALYANLNDFPLFAALSLLYFAAASFSEVARRLNQPDLANAFLLCDHSRFGPQLRSCCERATRVREDGGISAAARAILIDDIFRAIDPIDVAGLSDRTRRNWFPVDASDLFRSAEKLGVGETEIQKMLVRCGFFEA